MEAPRQHRITWSVLAHLFEFKTNPSVSIPNYSKDRAYSNYSEPINQMMWTARRGGGFNVGYLTSKQGNTRTHRLYQE